VTAALTSNRRALGALAVLAAAVVVVAGSLLVGLTLLKATWLEVDAQQTELEALQRRVAAATKAGTEAPEPTVDPFLEGGNFALASNSLQQRVVSLVEQSGGTLITVGVDPPSVDGEASRRVIVQAVAQMSNDGLQEILYRLESETPFVFVESLTATKASTQGAGETEEAGKQPLRLAVDLRVSAYFRKADQ
jgi:hypothetical protein